LRKSQLLRQSGRIVNAAPRAAAQDQAFFSTPKQKPMTKVTTGSNTELSCQQ
jgi:hypothetical protein